MDSNSSVWLTGFWGFNPEEEGVLGFTDPSDRDRLFELIGERQLVCIYGAASPETDTRLVHHLLGVLEVERTPIDSWDKMSDAAKKRNIALQREEKWRNAMPVRRAWRTTHTLDVKQIFPESYDSKRGRHIAKFGTWLNQNEAHWLLEKVPFIETEVFGEPRRDNLSTETDQASLQCFLKPSRGIFGSFGDRSVTTTDKPHNLYLAHFPASPELLAGKTLPKGTGLVKIGISGNLPNRKKALNISFPETAIIGWRIIRKAQFSDRAEAASAEDEFKKKAIESYGATSLGREFFVIDMNKAEVLFTKLSEPTGLEIRQE